MGDAGHPSHFEQSFHVPLSYDSNMIYSNKSNNRHGQSNPAGKLFVGGISWETTKDAFADYFSQYGELVDSIIMKDRYSQRPRGFGFVTFADQAVADQVLEKKHIIDGREVEVKKTIPKEEMAIQEAFEKKKIFVGGIPLHLTEDELVEYFSSYGKVVEHHIMLDHFSGRSRGFGFVTFETTDAVERVLSRGKTHELGGKLVEIKKAEARRHDGYYSAGYARPDGRDSSGPGRCSSKVQYDENADCDYTGSMDYGYNGYGSYDYYGGYGGSNVENPAGFYGDYGGYGYGFGFVNPMYNAGYGVGGYGMAGGLGGPVAMYGGFNGFATGGGAPGSRGYGSGVGGSDNGRFHPYRNY